MIRRSLFVLTLVCVTSLSAVAQKPTIDMYIQQVAKSLTTDAKKALPDLLIDRPDDPGVMFLHASLVEDSKRALPLFERIVQSYPTSEWADDALSRVILLACIEKDAAKAKDGFRKMRDLYSSSPLLPITFDALRMSVGAPPAAATPAAESAAKPAAATAPAATAKKDTPAEDASAPVLEKPYTLNTKILPSKAEAQKVLDSFKAKRMRARMAEKWVTGKRNWVIQVGEYETEVAAARDIEVVRSICKSKPVVVKRQ